MKRNKQKVSHQFRACTTICMFALILAFLPQTLFAQTEFYTPKSLLIPLHDQKNQLHISVGRGGGYDLNLSYAFTDKLAFFHTATFDNGVKRRTGLFGGQYNVVRYDLVLKGGLGYFTKTNSSLWPILEVYAGAGISNINNYSYLKGDSEDLDFTLAEYWSVFGQLNAGRKKEKSEYSAGLRLTYSKYLDFDVLSTYPYNDKSYENFWHLSADPVISSSYVLHGFKLNVQAGIAIPLVRVALQHSYDPSTGLSPEVDYALPIALLGRLSVQYNLNFGKDK